MTLYRFDLVVYLLISFLSFGMVANTADAKDGCNDLAERRNATAEHVRKCQAEIEDAKGNSSFSPFGHWFLGGYQEETLLVARDEARKIVDLKHAAEIEACNRLAEVEHYASPLLQARAKAARERVKAMKAERAEKSQLFKKWNEGLKADRVAGTQNANSTESADNIVTSGESWWVTGQSASRHVKNELSRAHAAAFAAGLSWTTAEAKEANLMASEPGILHKLKATQHACDSARRERISAEVTWRKSQHDIEVKEASRVSRDMKLQAPLAEKLRGLRKACSQARSDYRVSLDELYRCLNNLPPLDATGAAEKADAELRSVEEDVQTDPTLPERPMGGFTRRAWTAPSIDAEDVAAVYATGATGAETARSDNAATTSSGMSSTTKKVDSVSALGQSALDKTKKQLAHVKRILLKVGQTSGNLNETVLERGHLVHKGGWDTRFDKQGMPSASPIASDSGMPHDDLV